MGGEGGDDIMVGNGGQTDRYLGASGFDWAVFKDDPFGVVVDLTLRAFDETPVPLSAATTQARFESVEGLSGSAFDDILRGDDFQRRRDRRFRCHGQRAHQYRPHRRPAGPSSA